MSQHVRANLPFVGVVTALKRLDDDTRREIADFVAERFEVGDRVEVVVRRYKSKRSLAQNNRHWALMTVGATSLWEDPGEKDTLHNELAHLYFGLPPCPKTGLRRRRHTPKTDTKEFAQFTDWCVNKLITLGADLSEWDAETEKIVAA